MMPFTIAKSPIQGRGLFATRRIKKGEKIFTVTGPSIFYPSGVPDSRNGSNWLQIRKNVWKMPLRHDPWNFINHACEPNVGILGQATVVAMRDIRSGEELTIDYSTIEADERWHMSCRCGRRTCRSAIRSIQSLPRELFLEREQSIPKRLRVLYLLYKTNAVSDGKTRKVIAKHPIKTGEVIFTVEGSIVHYTFPPNYKIGYSWLAIGKNTWIIPSRKNPWMFIRHSCKPNAIVSRHQEVMALRSIKPGEEITVDDAATEIDPNWKHACHCGASCCRGMVRSIQYLDALYYKRYEKYLPAFARKAYQEGADLRKGKERGSEKK